MKSLIDFFVDRYKATFTFLAFTLIWGYTSIIQLPASAYSDINIPYVFVSTYYDGVSAQDAERLLTRPIEQKLKTVDELVDICLLYTSPSPRDRQKSRMPSSA